MDTIGTEYAETLTGTQAGDTIDALGGNDVIYALGGDDNVEGGAGNDLIYLGDGDDDVWTSSEGNDTYYGGNGSDDITCGGTDGQRIYGGDGDDFLTGGNGDDALYGDAGDDWMSAGEGNDYVHLGSALGLHYSEALGGEGNDTLWADFGFSSSAINFKSSYYAVKSASGDLLWQEEFEVFDLRGSDYNDTISTGAGNDTVYGMAGNDSLFGGTGGDFMVGGPGNDIYYLDNLGDVAAEAADEGIDRVTAAFSYTLPANIENLILVGVIDRNGNGNALANYLTGTGAADGLDGRAGNDTLRGVGGADTLHGGYGNDSIDAGAVAMGGWADGGYGTDILKIDLQKLATGVVFHYDVPAIVSGSDTLYAHSNFEKFDVTGTAGGDRIYGGNGASTLDGRGGNDVLMGGKAADTLLGGAGNDWMSVGLGSVADRVDGGEGVDSLSAAYAGLAAGLNLDAGTGRASSAFRPILTFSNIESLQILGSIFSDTLRGGAGNDWLDMDKGGGIADGGAGIDHLSADLSGEATGVVFSAPAGTVVPTEGALSRTLLTHANFEKYTICGTPYDDTMVGGTGDDRLDMGKGRGRATGGRGNDMLVVDFGNEVAGIQFNVGAPEVTSGGTTIFTQSDFEYFSLIGTNAADSIAGGNNDDSFFAGGGGDTLEGGAGDDSLGGGEGNDRVDCGTGKGSADGGAGTDTLAADFSLVQGELRFDAAVASVVSGNGDTLLTQSNFEAFEIIGTPYEDTMIAGPANDILVMGTGRGIANGGDGTDILVADFANETAAVKFNAAVAAVISGATTILTQVGFEAFYIAGSNYDDTLVSGDGADMLNMRQGRGSANGGAGNDKLSVDFGKETAGVKFNAVVAAVTSGTTTVLTQAGFESFVVHGAASGDTITGGAATDMLYGEAGNDILVGGGGTFDIFFGGAGDDTYVVATAKDIVIEYADAGIDTVRSSVTHTLGNHQENLVLTGAAAINGTGNPMANRLTGNAAGNILDGRAGVDTMTGGAGDDTYYTDESSDVVNEAAGGGVDTVHASCTRVLGANQENLVLIEPPVIITVEPPPIGGTGNSLNNRITGNVANNRLNGGAGADTMIGGLGNDTYVVDNTGDVVTEATGGGTDTVQSSITHTLAANVENLTFTGIAAINGYGNALNNAMTGNATANILNGGEGADSMAGGLGNDIYVVDNTGDVVTEATGGGIDTVQSAISYTLGAGVENLVLIRTAAVNGYGNALNNTMTGNAAANTLTGSAGNDALNGGIGNDKLVGASTVAPYGAAEIDTLTGGTGNDIFYLGVAGHVLYSDATPGTAGTGGYALITDFSEGDRLQLAGTIGSYYYTTSPAGLPAGQALYSNDALADDADDLIAIIQGPNAGSPVTNAILV